MSECAVPAVARSAGERETGGGSRVSWLWILVGLLAACAIPDAEAPARTETEEVGPVTGRAGASPDTATLVAEWSRSLPELTGDARTTGLAVEPSGAVWVAGRAGTLVRIAGDDAPTTLVVLPEVGSAPSIMGVAADAAGVWVRDVDRGIVHVDDMGAQGAAWLSVPGGPLLWGRRALAVDSAGRVWVGIHPSSDAASDARGPRSVYARLSGSDLVDTLHLPAAAAESCPNRRDPDFQSGWLEDFRERYVPFVQWTLLQSATLAAGCPATYAFHLVSPLADERAAEGNTKVQVVGWTPLPVSAEERRDFTAAWVAMMRNRARPGAGAWTWAGDSISSTKPAYTALLADERGGVWVWPSQPSVTVPANPTWPLAGLPDVLWIEPGTGTFDVFDAEGRLRGHVRLPSEFRYTPTPETPEPVIRGDTVWSIVDGADGAPAVTRFVVVWP